MYVETWLHFREVLEAIYFSLPKARQLFAALLFPFIDNNKGKTSGIDQEDINNILDWLQDIQRFYPEDPIKSDIRRSITFLACINKPRAAKSLYTVEGCRLWGHFWYGDGCHEEPQVEPEPKPKDKTCSECTNESECLKAGCYWIERQCWYNIEDYLRYFLQWDIVHTRLDVSNKAVKDQMNYMKALTEYFINEMGVNPVFAQEAAVYQLLGVQVEASVDSAFASIDHIVDRIGDIGRLDGKTVVDAILSVEGGEETITLKLVENLLGDLGFDWSETSGHIYRISGGFTDKLRDLLDFLTDEQGNYIILTLDSVKHMLETDYDITTGTIKNISVSLDYAYEQVKGVEQDTGSTLRQVIQNLLVAVSGIIDVVSGEIEREAFPLDAHALDWMPASFGWVKEKLTAVGNIIFDCIEETTLALAEQINKIGTIVVSMPDWWIEELKIKLGI